MLSHNLLAVLLLLQAPLFSMSVACPLPPSDDLAIFPDSCGSTCVGRCIDGYDGTVNAVCIDSGWKVVSSCVPKNCGPPVDIPDHVSIEGCQYFYGGNCTAKCSDGYDGSVSAVCLVDAIWQIIPDCQPVICQPPDMLDAVFHEQTYIVGEYTGSCLPGRTGNPKAECYTYADDDGLHIDWRYTGECRKVTCGEPGLPANAQLVQCHGHDYGALCIAYCNPGSIGSVSLICDENGNWHTGGSCEPDRFIGAVLDQYQAHVTWCSRMLTTQRGNSFIAGVTGNLSMIRLSVGINGAILLRVYAGQGFNGRRLLQRGIETSTGIRDLDPSTALQSIILSPGVPVQKGQIYTFGIQAVTSNTGVYSVCYGELDSNPLTRGAYWETSGGRVQSSLQRSLVFETWVIPESDCGALSVPLSRSANCPTSDGTICTVQCVEGAISTGSPTAVCSQGKWLYHGSCASGENTLVGDILSIGRTGTFKSPGRSSPAFAFTTPDEEMQAGFILQGVLLQLSYADISGVQPTPSLWLVSDDELHHAPSGNVIVQFTNPIFSTGEFNYLFTPETATTLSPDTKYWLVFDLGGAPFQLRLVDQFPDPWPIGYGGWYEDSLIDGVIQYSPVSHHYAVQILASSAGVFKQKFHLLDTISAPHVTSSIQRLHTAVCLPWAILSTALALALFRAVSLWQHKHPHRNDLTHDFCEC